MNVCLFDRKWVEKIANIWSNKQICPVTTKNTMVPGFIKRPKKFHRKSHIFREHDESLETSQ